MNKKFYTLCTAALISAGAVAQQLPNGDFDGEWVDCLPDGVNAVRIQPEGWMASNVYKYFFLPVKVPLIFQDTDSDPENNADGYSVRMENLFAGALGIGATAPGYITLGSSWAYGDITNVGKPEDTSDGGSYGSLAFTYRPDAISLDIKRTLATEEPSSGSFNSNEVASVIFYAWKGQTSSTVTTGLSSSPVETTMVDREKDVLGMITEDVTKSEDFELIAKSENYIEGSVDTWTNVIYPIEYVSDNAPEKINIIIASSDYFHRENLGTGNTLNADNVKLVYYSTLSALTVNGEEVTLEEGTYEYAMEGAAPADANAVAATTKGRYANAEVAVNGNIVTITVTNQGGEDVDGETSHTYTLTYESAAATGESTEYTGFLNISMGTPIVTDQEATVTITDNGDGTCTFMLPNLTLGDLGVIGDIVLEGVTMTEGEDGATNYAGSEEDMSLLGGMIHAGVVLEGTINANDKVEMTINVSWYKDYPANTQVMPIVVTFTSDKLDSVNDVINNAATVYGTSGAVVINGYTGDAHIYNIAGQLVKATAVDGNAEIALPTGIYIVRTSNSTVKAVVK